MKRAFCVIILAFLVACNALCESGRMNDSDVFEYAVGLLRQMDSRDSIEEALDLFMGITSNYNQAKSFGIYTTAILSIYDGDYNDAEAKIAILEMNNEFTALLESNGLQKCDVLRDYIRASQLEALGDKTGALKLYSGMVFKDSLEKSIALISQAYDEAVADFRSGRYEQAAETFAMLGYYRDSAEMAKQARALIPTPTPKPTPTPIPMAVAGDIILFGMYEQDNVLNNGLEPIEWIVLDAVGEKALLLSKYSIDLQQYNVKYPYTPDLTWEKCSLRKWLNTDFLEEAFNQTEQSAIQSTIVNNDRSQCYIPDPFTDLEGGRTTMDKLFLLSYKEVMTYLKDDEEEKCAATNYVKDKFIKVYNWDDEQLSNYTINWCLRSPSLIQSNVMAVNNDDFLNSGYDPCGYFGVRPAMWVDLRSVLKP